MVVEEESIKMTEQMQAMFQMWDTVCKIEFSKLQTESYRMKEIHVDFLDRLMDSYTHAANMLLLIVSCFQENKNSNTLNNSDTARMVLKKCELLLKSHHEVELDVSIMLKSLSQHKQHAQVKGKELKKVVSEMQNTASLAKLTV